MKAASLISIYIELNNSISVCTCGCLDKCELPSFPERVRMHVHGLNSALKVCECIHSRNFNRVQCHRKLSPSIDHSTVYKKKKTVQRTITQVRWHALATLTSQGSAHKAHRPVEWQLPRLLFWNLSDYIFL